MTIDKLWRRCFCLSERYAVFHIMAAVSGFDSKIRGAPSGIGDGDFLRDCGQLDQKHKSCSCTVGLVWVKRRSRPFKSPSIDHIRLTLGPAL